MRKENLKFDHCLFQKSAIKGVFNKKNANETFPFSFIKFSKPKADYLIENGVCDVVQSWKLENRYRIKTLHSGLFNLGEGIYIGNNINDKEKKDFILLYVKDKNQIQFFLIKNCNPKKHKFVFAMDLFEHFKSLNLINN